MRNTIGTIVTEHFDAYASTHRLPAHVHRAARQIGACRTGKLGGHLQACPEGHEQRVVYHSCRNRLCPQCNALPTERWLQKMRARLIDCAHHHLIFTMPHALLELWRFNRPWFTQALFSAVADTLHTLLRDARYLGAEPGFVLALHTWSRSMALHPHIHALVSDGGLDAQGAWQGPRKSCFLPARVVMALFRGKLLAALAQAAERGTLVIAPQSSVQQVRNLCNRLGRCKWNVHIRARYAHGHGVMTYLARYVRGGPLKPQQVLDAGERITLRYRSHRDEDDGGGTQYMTLTPAAFLGRYLQHTPLPVHPVVRHYGLYSTRRGAVLDAARAAHGQCTLQETTPAPIRAEQYYVRRAGGPTPATHCSQCGAALVRTMLLAPQRGPPCTARPA